MSKIINGVKCRTREESLKHILKEAKAGRIAPTACDTGATFTNCQYQYPSGNHCAVGSLFSKAQLEDIQAKGGNEWSVDFLATKVVGKKNIETVTGMALKELKKLQELHDETLEKLNPEAARQAVANYCKAELANIKYEKAQHL